MLYASCQFPERWLRFNKAIRRHMFLPIMCQPFFGKKVVCIPPDPDAFNGLIWWLSACRFFYSLSGKPSLSSAVMLWKGEWRDALTYLDPFWIFCKNLQNIMLVLRPNSMFVHDFSYILLSFSDCCYDLEEYFCLQGKTIIFVHLGPIDSYSMAWCWIWSRRAFSCIHKELSMRFNINLRWVSLLNLSTSY